MLKNERGNVVLKFVDRYVGIPIVFALSFFRRRKKAPPPSPQRIGLLIPAAIGDTIVASPVFDALRARFPNAEIVAFASSSNMAIFPMLESLSRVVNLPIKRPWQARKVLRQEGKFDWWIDLGQWARLNAIFSYFTKSDYKVGFRTLGQHRHRVYDFAVTHSGSVHELENFNHLLSPFNMKIDHTPQIHLGGEHPKGDGGASKNQILIHIFAGGSKPYLKEWPLENWKNLIDYLTAQGFQIVLTGVKENKQEADQLIQMLKSNNLVVNAVGVWNLQRVAQEMRVSRLVISVNTGIMHLAAALNCNLVSLQGPTSVKRWGPTNKNSVAIQSPLACSPCLNLGFEYGCPYNKCMQAISLESVTTAANKFLL